MPAAVPTRHEVLGKLPFCFPDMLRFKAREAGGGRDLELRVVRKDPQREVHHASLRAFEDLCRLRHRAFPPVLDRGEFSNCLWYAIPLRVHSTLEELTAAPEFGDAERLALLRRLAAALAAAHRAGIALGSLLAGHVALDAEAGEPWIFAHGLPLEHSGLPTRVVAPDCRTPNPPSPRGDVFCFGLLAARLMARRAEPWEDAPGTEVPFRYLVPDSPAWLRDALQACLSWRAADRPADGDAVLARLEPPEQPLMRVGEDDTDLSDSMRRYRQRKLAEGPVDELVTDPGIEDSGLAELDRSWRHQLQAGSPVGLPEPAPPADRGWVPALGAALGGGLLAWLAFGSPAAPPAPPPRPPASRAVVPVPPPPPPLPTPTDRAGLQADPRVATLLAPGATDRTTLGFRLKLARRMREAGLIPEAALPAAEVEAIRKAVASDPAAAAARLDRFRAAWSVQVGWLPPEDRGP